MAERQVLSKPIEINERSLAQPVASSPDGKIYTLGDYITTHAPSVAKMFRLSLERVREHEVPRVDELSNEALRQVVLERIRRMPSGIAVAVLGPNRSYTPNQLEEQVERRTEIGEHIVAAERRGIAFLEQMVDQGRVVVGTRQPGGPWPGKPPKYRQ